MNNADRALEDFVIQQLAEIMADMSCIIMLVSYNVTEGNPLLAYLQNKYKTKSTEGVLIDLKRRLFGADRADGYKKEDKCQQTLKHVEQPGGK